jgi:RNA polymerase sigma-70 factor (ECF subfamily)
MDESQLVRLAQAGDRAAFESLVRLHAKLVWAAVYGLIRDPAWTEDLVQETFLRMWESIGDVKEPAAFRGYLLTTARRLAWRHSDVAGRAVPMAEPPEPAPVEEKAPALDPEEAHDKVQEALTRLPERYRVPVTLHYVNGMEYAEISATTGMESGSLRGLLTRGLARLRAELAPWWRRCHERA